MVELLQSHINDEGSKAKYLVALANRYSYLAIARYMLNMSPCPVSGKAT